MRLIDADALFDKLFYAWGTEIDAGTANEFMMMLNDAPTITPPLNAPLTLDELREMDGEPVWIAPATDGGKISERWMLVSDYLPENGIFLFMPPGGMTQGYKAGTYGKIWLAYRHRPEEV